MSLLAVSLGAQEGLSESGSAETAPSILEILPYADLSGVSWEPRWPQDLLPGAFALHPGNRAASIVVSSEPAPGAEPKETQEQVPYRVQWSASGRIAALPLFFAGARIDVSFVRNSGDEVVRIDIAESESESAPKADAKAAGGAPVSDQKGPAPKNSAGSGKSGAKDAKKPGSSSSMRPKYGPGGIVESVAAESDEGVSYTSLTRGGAEVDEIRYGEDGIAVSLDRFLMGSLGVVSRISVAEDGSPRIVYRLDFDSRGKITRLADESGSVEATYGGNDEPVAVRVSVAEDKASPEKSAADKAGSDTAAGVMAAAAGKPSESRGAASASGAAPIPEELRFQWDERGLLVRRIEIFQDGKRSETAYSYTFNRQGDWIMQSSVVYAERFGVLVGEEGPTVRRAIRYR